LAWFDFGTFGIEYEEIEGDGRPVKLLLVCQDETLLQRFQPCGEIPTEVIGRVTDGEEACRILAIQEVDLVVLDDSKASRLKQCRLTLKTIRTCYPHVRTVLLRPTKNHKTQTSVKKISTYWLPSTLDAEDLTAHLLGLTQGSEAVRGLEVLQATAFGGTFDDAANTLCVSVGAVRTRLYRARKHGHIAIDETLKAKRVRKRRQVL
jgi:hypothetical protein